MQRYTKMCRENEPVAEAFVYYISDVLDESDNMSDSELRRKMNYGYKQVLDMLSGNIFEFDTFLRSQGVFYLKVTAKQL